jgi:hypothetical protein
VLVLGAVLVCDLQPAAAPQAGAGEAAGEAAGSAAVATSPPQTLTESHAEELSAVQCQQELGQSK